MRPTPHAGVCIVVDQRIEVVCRGEGAIADMFCF